MQAAGVVVIIACFVVPLYFKIQATMNPKKKDKRPPAVRKASKESKGD